MRNNRYNKILKATGLFGGVQGLNMVLNIVRTKIVAVLLGPAGVGLNGIYNETRELLHTTTNLGLDISGVRGISQAYEKICNGDGSAEAQERLYSEIRLLRSWVVLLGLFGALLCMAFASPLSYFTFGDYDHVWGYVILSPAVAFSTVTCGELAVLKGLRKLKSLAVVSVINVLLGLFVSVPIYYVWGIEGVLPALVAFCCAMMVNTLVFGYRAYKPSFSLSELGNGSVMLTVGSVFVVCGILAHLVELFIQSYLNNTASVEMVGLYNACNTMTASCVGMIFAAMDQDYFPRLTGVANEKIQRTETVSRQQDVMMMVATPLLVTFVVALPVVVPLFLSSEFCDMIPMAQAASIGLLCRVIYLSHAYIPLATGDKGIYFIINVVGALDLLLVVAGYIYGGLLGMGIALSVQHAIDLTLVMCVSRWKYGVVLSNNTIMSMVCYFIILMATYASCVMLEGWAYWTAGVTLIAISCIFAYQKYTRGK